MTKGFKEALQNLIVVTKELVRECDKQGVDSMGYIHYLEAYHVEQVKGPLALVCKEFECEMKKHGDYRQAEGVVEPQGGTK